MTDIFTMLGQYFTDTLSYLVSVVNIAPATLHAFFVGLSSFIIALTSLVVYPILEIICLMWAQVQYMYAVLASFLNSIISIPNTINAFFTILSGANLPSMWTFLILLSVLLNVLLALYYWLCHFYSLIPFKFT